MKKNNAGGLGSFRFAYNSAGMAIIVYIQKLCARKAARVKNIQIFLLRLKLFISSELIVRRRAKKKKAVAMKRTTTNVLKTSGMSTYRVSAWSAHVYYMKLKIIRKYDGPIDAPKGR